jgi:hypothetical protein
VAVPERARLIVDGTIASGKAAAVTIALRIRDARDGAVLETLSATAPSLAKIDAAAAELSARLPALIRGRLAALRKPPPADSERARAVEARKPSAADPGVAVALADAPPGSSAAILRSALEPAIVEWARAHHRELHSIAPAAVAAKTIAARGTGLAIGLWPLEYRADAHPLPMARARVRVQISDARTVVFDRVVVTDTVLGERGMAPADVAARVAREILAILRPHLRRSVPAW